MCNHICGMRPDGTWPEKQSSASPGWNKFFDSYLCSSSDTFLVLVCRMAISMLNNDLSKPNTKKDLKAWKDPKAKQTRTEKRLEATKGILEMRARIDDLLPKAMDLKEELFEIEKGQLPVEKDREVIEAKVDRAIYIFLWVAHALCELTGPLCRFSFNRFLMKLSYFNNIISINEHSKLVFGFAECGITKLEHMGSKYLRYGDDYGLGKRIENSPKPAERKDILRRLKGAIFALEELFGIVGNEAESASEEAVDGSPTVREASEEPKPDVDGNVEDWKPFLANLQAMASHRA